LRDQLTAAQSKTYLFGEGQEFGESEKKKKERLATIDRLTAAVEKQASVVASIEENKIYRNAFEWRFEFPEVLDTNGKFLGFDVILGNPPYMIIFDLDQKAYYERSFVEFKRNNDLYVAFIRLAFGLIKRNGKFSFITPNTFIKGNYFAEIRRFFATKTQILEIVDFGNVLVFEEVNVFCSITTAINNDPKKDWILKGDVTNIKGIIPKGTIDFIVTNALVRKINLFEKFDDHFLVKDVGFNY